MATETLPDDRALRIARRERALEQMAIHDLDLLVLGRQANVRYVSGTPQLWVAGTRPFGPICVLERATGEVHLNSTWDEGVPDEIGRDRLYGLSWSPFTLTDVLKSLPASVGARRVGTDALSPTFAQLLPQAFPNAELVDGEPAMRAARRIKTDDEIVALRLAVDVAGTALAAALRELAPDSREPSLVGALMEAMTMVGVSTPATQNGAWVTSRDHPWRRASEDGRIRAGDLVAFAAGALAGGYVGEVGRTAVAGDEPSGAAALFGRSKSLTERLFAACRPGAPATGLLDAYREAGEALPPMPVAHGLGMGFDSPVVSADLARSVAAATLEAGMVLAVTGYVWQEGVGAVFTRDAVHVTEDGPVVLTSVQGGQ
ncbi:M24 family metallopeptidase [Mycobacterium sp. CVI_P3]|uniref:M24 family metallopeptidase n=1 Tax=Mycobacterium pinniadriaticum TaxID=2994102 RepID=A0ABT3S7Y0_9MYCO|nr:M24 family metallopeptidase [Mycobacterium pinniadriaticum]MCX2929172.1 M24 family metallopeptidase [Mycobacterium pinniadriaticum]MCX2935597.1 M24 family metallopeptidase [Mycobacterium pinniadriaticum]